MERNFKHIASSIRLPESSRARIRVQIAAQPEKQEVFMTQKKRQLPRLAVAILLLAAALTLTAAGTVIHKWSGFVWIGGMSEAEKKRMLEETSYLTAVEVIDADGTVHYIDENGNETMTMSESEAIAYRKKLIEDRERAVCESTTLVDISTMPYIPSLVTELPVAPDGSFAEFGFDNAHMVLLYPEGTSGFLLKAGDTVTLSLNANEPCGLGFGMFKDGAYVDETRVFAQEQRYTFRIEEDGVYCFFAENLSAGMCTFTDCTAVVG